MISRKTSRILGEFFSSDFSKTIYTSYSPKRTTIVSTNSLYDFLFDNDYPSSLCNLVKNLHSLRGVKEFIMKLHTGETQFDATPKWSWEDRKKLGVKYLEDLAEDMLNRYNNALNDEWKNHYKKNYNELKSNLEFDGYIYKNSQLLKPEIDVLDVEETKGVLHKLYLDVALGNQNTAFHHLELSEEHYHSEKWDDSISNSRKFLECVLQEVSERNNILFYREPLKENIKSRPVKIREYLENEKLLESKEKEALSKVYALLSHTGGHPYMAENDQARLLRNLSLTFSHFVMLKFIDFKLLCVFHY